MLLPQDVSLDEPRDPGFGLILDKSTSRYRENLIQLFQGELLGLPHEQEGKDEGDDVGSGVEA